MILTGKEARAIVIGNNKNWEFIETTREDMYGDNFISIFKDKLNNKYYEFHYAHGEYIRPYKNEKEVAIKEVIQIEKIIQLWKYV